LLLILSIISYIVYQCLDGNEILSVLEYKTVLNKELLKETNKEDDSFRQLNITFTSTLSCEQSYIYYQSKETNSAGYIKNTDKATGRFKCSFWRNQGDHSQYVHYLDNNTQNEFYNVFNGNKSDGSG